PLPPGAASCRPHADLTALTTAIRRAYQLARSLPTVPLHAFETRIAGLPRTTEAERLVVQRVGQDVFRAALLDFWQGRCPLTGLAVPALLRASHIKPWADCQTDAERLDVYNGLLLAPHLDAAFDLGFITFTDEGGLVCAEALPAEARSALGLMVDLPTMPVRGSHGPYLGWHRERVFRGSCS
ncbi:MAG: HNH endonuclease, partial [Candidatus Sericytochromatia bacterium]|nr:HNH endonuclease [Candidatus Sericytochromatia bacterium]